MLLSRQDEGVLRMNDFQRERALEIVDQLKEASLNSGLLAIGGTVVLRSPGSPFDTPTVFGEDDLSNAVDWGLLGKSRVTGSCEWEWYTTKS